MVSPGHNQAVCVSQAQKSPRHPFTPDAKTKRARETDPRARCWMTVELLE